VGFSPRNKLSIDSSHEVVEPQKLCSAHSGAGCGGAFSTVGCAHGYSNLTLSGFPEITINIMGTNFNCNHLIEINVNKIEFIKPYLYF